jgi:hypothetical protein
MNLTPGNPDDTSLRRLAVTAEAKSSDLGSRQRARLVWRDPESGSFLEVDLMGSHAFLEELEALGFELQIRQVDTVLTGRSGGSESVRSSDSAAPAA